MNLSALLEKYRKYKSKNGQTCDICQKEIFDYPQPRVCSSCRNLLAEDKRKSCPVCGRKLVSDGVCLTCKAFRPFFEKGVSPYAYEGVIAGVINRLKNGARYLAYFFAESMEKSFVSAMGGAFDKENAVIVCVPLAKEKRKERGYNQAEEIAKVLKDRLGVPFLNEAVIKRRETQPQKERTGKERTKNIEGAYFVHKRKACKGKTVILVDDIMTTGATGSEIARILYAAGAKKVYFITAAATPEKK